jgi:hypothetical protein
MLKLNVLITCEYSENGIANIKISWKNKGKRMHPIRLKYKEKAKNKRQREEKVKKYRGNAAFNLQSSNNYGCFLRDRIIRF